MPGGKYVSESLRLSNEETDEQKGYKNTAYDGTGLDAEYESYRAVCCRAKVIFCGRRAGSGDRTAAG